MKGDVPVAYIVALILGIIVLAGLGYWFYTVFRRGSGVLSKDECVNTYHQSCESWKNLGCPPTMSTKVRCDDNSIWLLSRATGIKGEDLRGMIEDKGCTCSDYENCKGCKGGWFNIDLDVDAWWKFTGPNCKDDYGIDIRDCEC